ncbi:hypothetical protein [Vibrio sp. D431a]|uniref:hypothetical protein n=1 Tax=Vibrio sp. D431a TaxID=2837388 RepID=UPI0025552D1F|nr:hypothetical protein [Vibrio sp. D431a]MDK9790083.1 hypothetical protein [Vibrio sp. D431a]
MMVKGRKFRLYKRGYPDNFELWFSFDKAAEFEGRHFPTHNEAHLEMIRLCEEAGTHDDPNFVSGRPLVVSEEEYVELMGEDTAFSWY